MRNQYFAYAIERERGQKKKKPRLVARDHHGEHRERVYSRLEVLENGKILHFDTPDTADAWVAQHPTKRERMTIRELQAFLHTSREVILRVAEDGEHLFPHVHGIPYEEDKDGCWIALGDAHSGHSVVRDKKAVARTVYEAETGQTVPSRSMVQQTCSKRNCVKPDHLRVITIGEYNHDRASKLPYETLAAIKAALQQEGEETATAHAAIAERFGINESLVSYIASKGRRTVKKA